MTPPAAGEDAIIGDFSLRVEVGAVFGDGVRERDDEDADEGPSSCFCNLDRWKCNFSLHLA